MGLYLKSEAGKSGHHGHNGTATNGTSTSGTHPHHGTNATHALNATLNATVSHHHHWTVQQINQIPTGVQAVSAVALLISTSLCMVYPVWVIVTVVQFIVLFAVIVLRVWKVPLTLHCKLRLLNIMPLMLISFLFKSSRTSCSDLLHVCLQLSSPG
jgi:hypothetical protein